MSAVGTDDDLEGKLEAAESEIEQLYRALAHRGPIEQAKGMLMLLLETCDEEQAFQLLVGASQRRHEKVYQVASGLCEQLVRGGQLPREYRDAFWALADEENASGPEE